jgi:hypothetical protein
MHALGVADHAGVLKGSYGVCVDLRLEEIVIKVPGEAERLRGGGGLHNDPLLQEVGFHFTEGLDVVIEHLCFRGELKSLGGVEYFMGEVGLLELDFCTRRRW